jgi:hypothetical protein
MPCRLAPCLLLFACGTIRGYEGERLPREERAVIVSHCASAVSVQIVDIDGRKLDRSWLQGEKLELSPGVHHITLDVTWGALGRTAWLSWGIGPWLAVNEATERNATAEARVNVQAGGRYVFTASVTSRDLAVFEITDAETGGRVAGSGRPGILALEE